MLQPLTTVLLSLIDLLTSISFKKPHIPGTTVSIKIGHAIENSARLFLEQQGLQFITKNYHCRLGEIDLIMKDGNCWVFVEVRYRRNNHYGSSAETISRHKQAKIRTTAEIFLKNHSVNKEPPMRFDVIAITAKQLEWIKNAFTG